MDLAVKPQVIPHVAERVVGALKGKLLISIAAGVPIARLKALFGPMAIVRTMPNTPDLLGLGATGSFANDRVDAAQRARARTIVEAFGLCVGLPREDLLDAVTAVSGSGPAYFFLLVEEMIRAGVTLGLMREDATALTLQTALGAASMAAQGNVPPEELRRRVTSPNGTTHAAITSIQQDGLTDMISRAMTACRSRRPSGCKPRPTAITFQPWRPPVRAIRRCPTTTRCAANSHLTRCWTDRRPHAPAMSS